MKLIIKVGALISFALLSACAFSPKGAITDAPESASSIVAEYKIGVGDQLNVNVWRNPELSLQVPVRPDGKISLPLVGDIQAAGLSASDLNTSLQTALSNFIRNPQVTVVVTATDSTDYLRRVRITGAISNPISIQHREGMTVLDLVLEAGGLTEFAVPNKATLYRRTASGVQAYSIKVGDILNKGRLTTNYLLLPSDILTIPERNF